MDGRDQEAVVSRGRVDVAVAALLLLVGLVVVGDSLRVGIDWAAEGPRAGYFPFYIGLALIGSSVWTIRSAWVRGLNDTGFVERGQLRSVLQVFIPAAVFVAAINWIGIYVAGALYIAGFMAWIGRYSIWHVLPIAILVPVAVFITFEIWFLVPLPKGPVEALLGY